MSRNELIKEQVLSLLKAEGIHKDDREKAVDTLSECVAAKSCIDVYERLIYGKD